MHIGVAVGALSPYCVVVGSPTRSSEKAPIFLDDCTEVGNSRGLTAYTGTHRGVPMSLLTHGMASGMAAAAVEEAVRYGGARYILRVGTCSAFRPEAQIGDVAIWEGAWNCDGLSTDWIPGTGYPASANWEVIAALVNAARRDGHPHHVGIGVSTVGFYQSQGREGLLGYVPPHVRERFAFLRHIGGLACEMEMATILTYARIHAFRFPGVNGAPGLMAGGITAIIGNRAKGDDGPIEPGKGEEEAIRIAFAAMLDLHHSYPLINAE
jgi:uridine phosphorylase